MSRFLRSRCSARHVRPDEVAHTGARVHSTDASWRWACALAALLAAWIASSAHRVRRVVVYGPSMIPTLLEGDRLLVVRTTRLRVGDIAVLADPQSDTRLLVKRITAIGRSTVTVRGDNEGASRDSAAFGDVAAHAVLGVARYRYHPGDAAGRLPRGPR